MRPIDIDQIRRFAKSTQLEELEIAMRELSAIRDDADRRKYIDDNASKCSALRYALWMVGCGKCWYSERRIEADAGEVEHYRPKKRVWRSSPPHRGYWWHAFDWRNLRLAHPLVNLRRSDYSTEQLAGKGCYFPLGDESHRAITEPEEIREEPVLLDPTVARDCRLLCFDEVTGRPIPRYKKEVDEWKHRRAEESISFYHLNEGTWNADRGDIIRATEILCNKVNQAATDGNEEEYESLLDDLTKSISPFAEFSSVAYQVVIEKNLGFRLRPTTSTDTISTDSDDNRVT